MYSGRLSEWSRDETFCVCVKKEISLADGCDTHILVYVDMQCRPIDFELICTQIVWHNISKVFVSSFFAISILFRFDRNVSLIVIVYRSALSDFDLN